MIFSAVVLVFIGGAAAASLQFAGRVRSTVRGERKELVQYWEEGSFDEVFSRSRAALDSRPLDFFLLTMCGFSAYQLGISQINSLNAVRYFDDCVWSLRKALLLKNAENDGRLYYVLGKAYSYKGASYADLTVKYLQRAKELYSGKADNASALSLSAPVAIPADIPEYLGLAYAAIGDYRNSVAAFAEALEPEMLNPGGADGGEALVPGRGPTGPLLLSIARSYVALEEFEHARAYLQHCMEISPDSKTVLAARLLMSEVLQKSGDNEGAKQQLMDIIGEGSDNAEAHYQLGELYAQQGETARARAEWRLAVRADPAHIKARTRLSM